MKSETNILVTVVQQAGRGDSHAQGLLYGQFSKAMYNTCLRITGNRHDAEDLLQDSFVIAFRNLESLREEKNFGGWLKRIVINECLRYGKKNFRWSILEEDSVGGEENTDDGWITGISMERIMQEIRLLPDACRMVFTLYAIEDQSHREIATALGISESTSKSQYHRARQLLKMGITKKVLNG